MGAGAFTDRDSLAIYDNDHLHAKLPMFVDEKRERFD
jgi:hypothetical protein